MIKVNVALLSYGMSGQIFHAPFIQQHEGFNLVGAWERSLQVIAQDYPGVKSYPGLDALLADDSIELVVVNTPTYTHYDYALQALNAGKHVVVEKAFTTTVAEAKHLKEVADQKNLVLSIFQNRRWDSDFSTVRNVVNGNLLGDIHLAEFSFLRFKPALKTKKHFEKPAPGGGLLNDLGPHIIDQALSIFGVPEALFANIRVLRANSKVDDDFDLQLYYPGLNVRLHSSMMVSEVIPAYQLYGQRGSFLKMRTDKQEDLLRAGKKPESADWYTEPQEDYGILVLEEEELQTQTPIESVQGSYLYYYDLLYKAITSGGEVPVTAADGINVMRIIEAARMSSDAKKVINL